MADSYLKRAVSSSGNQRTYTVSAWCKIGNTDGSKTIFSSDVEDDGANYGSLSIEADGLIKFINLTSSVLVTNYQSNRKMLDQTSFFHIVLRVDTTQSTAGDRIRIYINGEQITSWAYSTTPNQNTDTGVFKSGNATLIGARHSSSSQNFWNGNLAHVHIVEGQSYAPTVFAEADSTTGEWKPILTPSVTYSADNSAFLKFENSGALGTDSSGESNDFTVVGSLKQSVSTPSNLFCTLDANQAYAASNIHYAGTSFLGTSTNARGCASTQMVKNGKWYFEVKVETDRTSADGSTISIAKNGTHAQRRWRFEGANAIVGKETGSNGCEGITYQPMTSTPNIIDDGGGGTVNYGSTASANDIIMVAVDLSAATSKIWFGKNGTWFNAPGTSNVGDPANGNNAGLSFAKGDDFWGINITGVVNAADDTNKYMFCNFGEGRFGTTAVASANADGGSIGAFEYAVPSGFYAICTKNIKDYG